jgi:hypothetical protein
MMNVCYLFIVLYSLHSKILVILTLNFYVYIQIHEDKHKHM